MDLHFFIWLLGQIENLAEMGRHGDVEVLVATVCAYHLQHQVGGVKLGWDYI